ncbi:MAG: hypothetical protein IAX21_07350 [Candidatus Bathyarchaeota archaeon]|nr:MAG: hypothetical protein IAX21_07350 [Candidatus Bathyarchaeota archaeon]
MLQAQLRGKLPRDLENMEDLLTSNVFGSIKYIQPEKGLLQILLNSEDSEGNTHTFDFSNIKNVTYHFWPWINESGCYGCEPDVYIKIDFENGSKTLVFVEAKYLSSKSSESDEKKEAPYDQLAREYDNLQELAAKENASPIFLYITADLGYPMIDYVESVKDYQRYKQKEMSMQWISWRKIPKIFTDAEKDSILHDLVKVIQRLGLTFYEGIKTLEPPNIEWSFKAVVNWDWSVYEDLLIDWEFKLNKCFNWKYQIESTKWRFIK